MFDNRNSLNQTSADKSFPTWVDGFFKPSTIVLTLPRDGLPLIENLYFFSPGSWLKRENSSISFKS